MSLREIEEHWTVDDLMDAHLALDLWETLEKMAHAKAKAEAAAAARR